MELIDLKKALADRAEDVCRLLLADGKLEKNEWRGGRLANGDGGHSLKIILRGDKAGVWKDFGGTTGGSNLLELWVQAKGVPFQDALREATDWLGVRGDVRASNIKPIRERAYAKPSTKGCTFIANKAEFYLTVERQIPKEIVALYKIAMTEDEQAIVFPYLSQTAPHKAEMLKFLKINAGKKVTWTSKDTAKVLFGKHTVRPEDRYLLISEGEADAMSWRALNISGLCCTSVPFGAKWEGKDGKDPNAEWIDHDWDFISRFERVYVAMDMDEEGRKAQGAIVRRLGREICFCIELPEPAKDGNELWMAGKQDVMRKAYESAKTLDPATLKNANEYRAKVMDILFGNTEAKRGIPLPFGPQPFHLRWNEWTAVTGTNGSGKSQLLGYLMVYLKSLGYGSCVASLEVRPERTISFYLRQTLGAKELSRDAAEHALDWLAGGIWLYDKVGETKWPELLSAFRYAYRRYGIRFFCIDSWMKMGIKGDDLDAQGECVEAFSQFVNECDVHLFVVAHPRKLKSESEQPGKLDVKGSGELTDQAHNVLTVWRNKAKEKEIEKLKKESQEEMRITQKRRMKPDALLIVGKQRNDDGDEPTIDLWYEPAGKQYFSAYKEKGVSFIDEKPANLGGVLPEPVASENIDEDTPF